MDPKEAFDESEIRDAERRLATALEAGEWVSQYTVDAVFDGGGEHATVGQAAVSPEPVRLQAVQPDPQRTHGFEAMADGGRQVVVSCVADHRQGGEQLVRGI